MVRLRGKSCPVTDRPSVPKGDGAKRARTEVLGEKPRGNEPPPPVCQRRSRRVWGQRPGQPQRSLASPRGGSIHGPAHPHGSGGGIPAGGAGTGTLGRIPVLIVRSAVVDGAILRRRPCRCGCLALASTI